jgi:5'(3')-deoxyribonucleotidase
MKYRNFKDINNKIPKPGSFKHFLRIEENGGRVVKGVNTTADVDTNSIKKQAAKFGNTVDKDGRPPTLSKKVKGSKTNVLFNLGMTESVDNTDESVLYYAKMAENLGELASTSKVYVDMDGVLADFFGEWQKLIGSDWRKVKDIEPALQAIRDKDNFWLDLPLLPQAKNLLGVIKKVKGSYTILSSPLPNDPNSEPHKREWIKKNLSFFPPENVIITHDKHKYATNSDGTPNILIDDFGKNIASWEAAGGEGFKHKDHKFERTAKAIKQHMTEPVAEEDKINKKIVQKAQGMMKPMYSSEIAAMVEDEFEAIREAALRRYKKAKGKIDLYTAYTMAIEDEFPEIPNPIFVFQYMTDPVDPNHQDIVPQEAEDGSWADRADKEYEQKDKSNPKGDGFDGKIKGRWFAIKADRDSYMDQGMEPEDALDKASERHGVDPEEVQKWLAAGNAVKIKESKQLNEIAFAAPALPLLMPVVGFAVRKGGKKLLDLLGRSAAAKATADNLNLEKELSDRFPGIDVNAVPKNYDDAIQRIARNPLPNFDKDSKDQWKKDPNLDDVLAFLISLIGSTLLKILLAAGLSILAIYALSKTAKYFKKKHDEKKLKQTIDQMIQANSKPVEERTLTKGEEKKKEKNVKGMKKNKGDFEKRYGKDAKAVMYATATKMAKESLLWSIETGKDLNESIDRIIEVLEEMDRREFMKTAGATAALSAMPGIAKAMSNDKLIVKADNGKVFDISKFPGTLQEKVKRFKEAIAKIYAKNNADVPSFKFYLNDKFMGQIYNDGNNYKKVPGEEDLDALAKRMRKESIEENFADGKKKGKSRPGRVKKSGASCSSSVTELRKKAKNASGERAKMYHWCANMKSGKKK